jgi:hypothetical protein
MSTIKTKNVQVGTDSTASNNFTIYTPGTPDGTVRIGNGDAGAVTDAITLDSSGNITAAQNLTVSGTTTATGAITSTGGIYLGGTASANLLDDYEEGTWTPYYTAVSGGSATYSKQIGTYVKNGDLVAASCHIIVSTHTFSGAIRVHGMPFTSKNNTLYTVSPIHIERVNIATNVFAWAYIVPNSTQGNIRYYQNNTGAGLFNGSQMNSGADIMMNFIYRAE